MFCCQKRLCVIYNEDSITQTSQWCFSESFGCIPRNSLLTEHGVSFCPIRAIRVLKKMQIRLIISPKMASTGGGWTHWLESAATEKPVHRRGEGVAVRLTTATRSFRRSTGRRSTRGTGDSSHGYFLLKHMMIITGVCFKKLSPAHWASSALADFVVGAQLTYNLLYYLDVQMLNGKCHWKFPYFFNLPL